MHASDTPVLALPWLGKASQKLGVMHHVTANNYCGNATSFFVFIFICRIMTENRLTLLERKQNTLLSSFFVSFFETPDPHSPDTFLWFWEDLCFDRTETAWLILPSQMQTFNKSLLLMSINHQNQSTCHYWGIFLHLLMRLPW